MKYQISLMLKQYCGEIVNPASGECVIGIMGGAAYAASKHTVVRLAKSAALDFA